MNSFLLIFSCLYYRIKYFFTINYFVFPCVSVAFALRDAVKASREEFGLEGDQGIPGWIHLCKDMIMFCIISNPIIQSNIYTIYGPVNIIFC